jgi:hypothetical protein
MQRFLKRKVAKTTYPTLDQNDRSKRGRPSKATQALKYDALK